MDFCVPNFLQKWCLKSYVYLVARSLGRSDWIYIINQSWTRWWFRIFWFFSCLGRWSNVVNIVQNGWNHQLTSVCWKSCARPFPAWEVPAIASGTSTGGGMGLSLARCFVISMSLRGLFECLSILYVMFECLNVCHIERKRDEWALNIIPGYMTHRSLNHLRAPASKTHARPEIVSVLKHCNWSPPTQTLEGHPDKDLICCRVCTRAQKIPPQEVLLILGCYLVLCVSMFG